MKLCVLPKTSQEQADTESQTFTNNLLVLIIYQAYLCKAHYETLLDDGVSLKIVEYVSELVQYELTLELIRNHTEFDDVEEFLRSTPTIYGFRGAYWLRQFYLEKTGKHRNGDPWEYPPEFLKFAICSKRKNYNQIFLKTVNHRKFCFS